MKMPRREDFRPGQALYRWKRGKAAAKDYKGLKRPERYGRLYYKELRHGQK